MARAFTKNKPSAVVAYPVSLLCVTPYGLMGGLYETQDRDGMVIFARQHWWVMALMVALIGVGSAVLSALIIASLGLLYGSIILAAAITVTVSGVVAMGSGATLGISVGPETPKGRRYEIAGLAQRPGSRLSAVQLALRLINTTPPGSVIVATAASDELQAQYERLGFTAGESRRVYKVTP